MLRSKSTNRAFILRLNDLTNASNLPYAYFLQMRQFCNHCFIRVRHRTRIRRPIFPVEY